MPVIKKKMKKKTDERRQCGVGGLSGRDGLLLFLLLFSDFFSSDFIGLILFWDFFLFSFETLSILKFYNAG